MSFHVALASRLMRLVREAIDVHGSDANGPTATVGNPPCFLGLPRDVGTGVNNVPAH